MQKKKKKKKPRRKKKKKKKKECYESKCKEAFKSNIGSAHLEAKGVKVEDEPNQYHGLITSPRNE
jgi:hypothetical protein